MRILFVKLGSIGDIVHTLPALAAVRRALPEARVSWVVERGAAEILRDNPLLESVIEIDTKALRRWPMSGETLLAPRQQLRRLRASAFDLSLDFQGLLKSAAVARLAGATRSIGFHHEVLREPASRFLLSGTVRVPAHTHVIWKNLSLVEGALSIEIPRGGDELEFPLSVSPADESQAAGVAERVGAPFAILNPGGNWPTKLWGAERFGALADGIYKRLGLRSIVTHGPGEKELAKAVEGASSLGVAQPATPSLKGFFALARRAAVYVGGDTGPTHLAVAAGAPVVGLFGPTEWWRNGSPRAEDICVERNDIDCREDCHRRSCSKWLCMDIEVERVLSAAAERVRRARARTGAEALAGA